MAENKMSVDKASFIFGLVLGIAVISVAALLIINSKSSGEVKGEKVAQPVADAGNNQPSAQEPQYQSIPPIRDDDYIKGDRSAKVEVVEYSDFQCPYCLRHNDTMDQIIKNYQNKIAVVFRHFPLTSIHPEAQKAAEAAECAGEQGKFWEMHDLLFQANANSTMSVDQWKKEAANLKLNTQQFDSCLDSGKYANKVAQEQSGGAAAGVQGTPATFINGEIISGAVPYEQIKAVIEAKLKE